MAKQQANQKQIARCYALIQNTGSQSLPAVSPSTVSLPTVTSNTGMTTGSNSIIVPTDGLYYISASISFDANNNRYDLAINGTPFQAASSQAYGKINVSGMVPLISGTSISLTVTNNNGSASTGGAALSVARISN